VVGETDQLDAIDRQRAVGERRARSGLDRLHRERLQGQLHFGALSSCAFWARRLSSLPAVRRRWATLDTRSGVKRCTGPAMPRLATAKPSRPMIGTATPTAPG